MSTTELDPRRPWRRHEDAIIAEWARRADRSAYKPSIPLAKMAELLGRTRKAVFRRAVRLDREATP